MNFKNKKTDLIKIFKGFCIITLFFSIIIVFGKIEFLYELPFFSSITIKYVTHIVIFIAILFIFIFLCVFNFFTSDKDQSFNNKYRYKPKLKYLNIAILYLLSTITALILCIFMSHIFFKFTDVFSQKISNIFGTKYTSNILITTKYIKNPDYNQKINLGTNKNPIYILDPSPIKFEFTLQHANQHYVLDKYCILNADDLVIPSKIQLQGKQSLLGFSCGSNCYLAQHFHRKNGQPLKRDEFSTCEYIYDKQPRI